MSSEHEEKMSKVAEVIALTERKLRLLIELEMSIKREYCTHSVEKNEINSGALFLIDLRTKAIVVSGRSKKDIIKYLNRRNVPDNKVFNLNLIKKV